MKNSKVKMGKEEKRGVKGVKALLLAAGKSTRIVSVSGPQPKPLLEICGLPVLMHNLKLLAKHRITEVWINLHYQPEMIQNEVGDGKKWGAHVRYSYEREILGTSGAIKNLSKEFSEDTFLVLYGDNFTDCDLSSLLKHHKQSNAIATIAVFDPTKNLNSGIAGGKIKVKENGMVEKFVEGNNKELKELNFVNGGIYTLEPKIIDYIPDGFSDFGKDIFPNVLKMGLKLSTYKMSGFCFALDTPESYQRTRELLGEIK